jgi:hypothetical protein
LTKKGNKIEPWKLKPWKAGKMYKTKIGTKNKGKYKTVTNMVCVIQQYQ